MTHNRIVVKSNKLTTRERFNMVTIDEVAIVMVCVHVEAGIN